VACQAFIWSNDHYFLIDVPEKYKILSEFSISIINMSYDNLLLPLVLCFEEISVIVENDIFKKI